MKRLLAFAASSTVAALLLLRILPELAADPEQLAEPEKPALQAEVSQLDAPREEAPLSALPLLLPPPPAPAQAPSQLVSAVPVAAPDEAAMEPKIESVAEAAVEATPKPHPIAKPAVQETRTAGAPIKRVAAARGPSPLRESASRAKTKFVNPGPAIEAEGRVLLRILEHGSGPVVQIAWPVSAIQRRALYRLFAACYGMEIAVIDGAGRLFRRAGEAGQPWQPNLDRYSGFVRQPSGRLTVDEKDSIAAIRAFHGGVRAHNNVRLFPRRLDALLLGGLKALIGDRYSRAAAIRAHYRRDGNAVLVEAIRRDGQPVLGRIDLSAAARHCRSGAWS